MSLEGRLCSRSLNAEKDTKSLYLSKAKSLWSCPQEYFYKYYLWITERETPSYLTYGSNFHKAVELYLLQDVAVAVKYLESISNEVERNQMMVLLDLFIEQWTSKKRTILSSEHSLALPPEYMLTRFDYPHPWYGKADFIFEDEDGIWNGDVKTTSGYGASTSAFYHKSLQTCTYFYINKVHMPEIKGTKIFTLTKTKDPKVFEETILLTKKDMSTAEQFISYTVQKVKSLPEVTEAAEINPTKVFPQNMFNCYPFRGRECPYTPLCRAPEAANNDYFYGTVNSWFCLRDPEEHLELKEKA